MRSEKYHIEAEGRTALGFDTGLSPAAFAQAKMAQLLSEAGYLVSSAGDVSPWRAEGVAERDGRMTVWGPDFPGERLDSVIERGGDAALDALRRWIAARLALRVRHEGASELPAPYPAAAFLGPDGTVLFAPERLALRALEARGAAERLDGAERWVHPDLTGDAAEAFAAAALAYRVLCAERPFGAEDSEAVRADMRDGCALPSRLVEGGLEPAFAALLDAALAPAAKSGVPRGRNARAEAAPRPSLADLAEAIGKVGSPGLGAFVRLLTEQERAVVAAERTRKSRSRGNAVKTKRFARRNASILVAVAAAAVGSVLIVRSIISDRSDRPTTAGMSPIQVVRAYYEAIGKLDHTLMEACVVDKAGKGDIEATMNLFVISRVRSAYERLPDILSAEEWIAQGSPPVSTAVYGVSGLTVEEVDGDASDGTVTFNARYAFWSPGVIATSPGEAIGTPPAPDAAAPDAAAPDAAVSGELAPKLPLMPPPVAAAREDALTLTLRDGLWRISAIDRKEIE